MLNEEEFKKIEEIIKKENPNGISSLIIEYLDRELDKFIQEKNSPDEFKLLLYASWMKDKIDDTITDASVFARNKYFRIGNVSYPVNRTISNICNDSKYRESSANDYDLEKELERIDDEIKFDKTLTHYKKKKTYRRYN